MPTRPRRTPLATELRKALKTNAGLLPQDGAAARLALCYADALDDGGDPAKVGPALLGVLDALLMTPRARAVAAGKGGAGAAGGRSELDEFRARRAARRHGAAAVDTTALQ